MQNLKYLKKIIDGNDRFVVILNDIALKHNENIQLKIALTIFEFFNDGKYISIDKIKKDINMFYIKK